MAASACIGVHLLSGAVLARSTSLLYRSTPANPKTPKRTLIQGFSGGALQSAKTAYTMGFRHALYLVRDSLCTASKQAEDALALADIDTVDMADMEHKAVAAVAIEEMQAAVHSLLDLDDYETASSEVARYYKCDSSRAT